MAGEQEFVTGLMSVLEANGFGWLAGEVRLTWLDDGIPLEPAKQRPLASRQAVLLVEVIETVLLAELESLNAVRSYWQEIRFRSDSQSAFPAEFNFSLRESNLDEEPQSTEAVDLLRDALVAAKSSLLNYEN